MNGALLQIDLNRVVSRLPSAVRDLIVKEGAVLGGGFIRANVAGEKPSDIDLFVRSPEHGKLCAYKLANEWRSAGARVHETQNALTVLTGHRCPVQFITRWTFERPEAVVESFDFTVAMATVWARRAAVCCERDHNRDGDCDQHPHGRPEFVSMTHAQFYPDLAARRLVYTHPVRNEDAGGSMLRVRKFLARGYHIDAPSLAGVISRLMNAGLARALDQVNVDAFQSMAPGERELMLRQVLTGLLREVDPLLVVDGTEAIDEHAIASSLREPEGGAE